jgi:hypothetical protein
MNFSVGRSGFLLGALLNTPEKRIGVELYLNDDDAKSYFGLLSQEKQRIEEELGFPLNWMELPDRKSCRLLLSLEDASPMDRQRWPEYRQWMKERLERFNAVFRPRVRALNANDWRTEEEDA